MLTGWNYQFYALVVNYSSNNCTSVDLTNPLAPVAGATVTVGANPFGVAISPDGKSALVVNFGSGTCTSVDLTNPLAPVAGGTVTVGTTPYSLGPSMIYSR